MIAARLNKLKTPLTISQVPPPKPKAGESLIDLHYAALNKRDDWVIKGRYPRIDLPVVLGSDGMGQLAGTQKRVIFNPGMRWGNNERFQGPDFQITGMPGQGTLTQQIAVLDEQIYPAPEHLTDAQSAALPLAGVTAYRGLFVRGNIRHGETVLVAGVGGGVATMAVKMALAAGAVVYVNSSSDKKIEKAIEWGCQGGWNYATETDWAQKCQNETGGVDLVLDGAGGNTISDYIHTLRPGGRLVFYGATLGSWKEVHAAKIYFRQIDIRGTTMGSNQDFADMVDFVTKHEIRPHIDRTYELEDINEAFLHLNDPDSFGKIVIKIPVS